ncbi:CBS DOMAIN IMMUNOGLOBULIN E-SET-RELATED [Salix purpurea]|uniref:CBS DOMAIN IMMUNOGLOBULIN E-SET-RELATED n=1 Tax=Salix purpurea TaxID=77065 RepID=A0A9Q0TXQ1_SALPP|nr:CBS DOMAIN IMMUNOGLOBULIN E-SET-RELATED [Salix purpurea]
METVREAGGGIAGTVLMRFVWTHGGRSVFLSGSFNRWGELIPMSPVEGCPNVFQAIYGITHGNHQYKFLVDGEWRHDELQPYTTTEYGILNTVHFNVEANFNPEMIPGSSMELDNEAFTRLVSVSDGTLTGAVLSISEADLQVSRHRISVFLTAHTAYELLPKSGKVVALDVDLPVKQAFHILCFQGIPIAPLWDFSRGQFVGVLSALDFILILRELGNNGSNLTEEELDTHTISAWKEGKSYLNRQIDEHDLALPRHLIHAGPHDNLKEVALRILQNEVATVPIIHSSSEDGSFPQLLHLASLSGILKCICRYFRHCAGTVPMLQLPIGAIPVGSWVPSIGEPSGRPLAMLRPSASLSSALNLLLQARVSSIPIVDENDSLVDIYCRSDITALAKDKIYTRINLNEMTINQALQLGQDAYSYELRSQRCQMCLRSDTLHKVMERLANPGVRRLVIVEAGSKRVEGIVTLSDIFRFLLG